MFIFLFLILRYYKNSGSPQEDRIEYVSKKPRTNMWGSFNPPSPSKPDSYPNPFAPRGWASAPPPQPDVHLIQPF